VQAYGGLTDLWSYPDGGPVGGNSNHPDLIAGHLCAVSALAGLLQRERTGAGIHCEVAQVEVVVATLGDLLLAEALAPRSVRPVGNDDDRGAPWGVFRCRGDEEWCVVCVRHDDDWAALRRAMGNPDWAGLPEWSTHAGRRAGRDELARRVGEWTATRTPAEVAAACQGAGVPGGPMLYASQLLTDPQLLERGFLVGVQQPDAGALTFDGVSFRASDMAPPHIDAAPRLGEHTRAICRDVLGLAPEEIERLVAEGVLEVAREPAPAAPETAPAGSGEAE
jgi:crotonobetainyl-CoA:carnitine CoA-transferase CaiB-like acyl-CoA transferase